MSRFLIIVFFVLANCVVAQNIGISGIVRDSKTRDIVPFATVELLKRQIGVAANFQGKFQIQVPDDSFNDTLKVCSLGYKPSQIIIGKLRNDFTNVEILLDPQVYSLNEVEIFGVSAGKYRLGNYEDNKNVGGGLLTEQTSQIAVFMDSKKFRNARILNARFFIFGKEGHPEAPFRVRVYGVDPKSGNPGDDLVHESIIVHGKRGGGWLTVDLSKFKLVAPATGYFIAMEWINSGDSYNYQTFIRPLNKFVKCYGQICSSSKTIKTSNTWNNILGKGWFKVGGVESNNSLIASEVEMIK